MSKVIHLVVIAMMLFVPLSLFADDDFITYTETFTHLGPEGGDPEYVFAEFIEDWSLYSVSQKFTAGTKEFYEPIIYFDSGEYHFDCLRIYNDTEYKIKLFKDRLQREKTKPKSYIPNPNPQTIIVDINGTGDYPTIQEGIDNASDGDIILVYPGTYYENINYSGKNITVASKYYTTGDESYIKNTIIDGNNSGSCVKVHNGETDVSLVGFTIQHGSGHTLTYVYGGGIYIKQTSGEVDIDISHCVIQDNTSQYGGGIYINYPSELTLKGTRIRGNHASQVGGGIYKGGYVTINFSQDDLCNIYLNYSPMGSDIYNNIDDVSVYVDTFTVQEPDKFYVYSNNNTVTMNILHPKIEQMNDDIYVSPDGNNTNSGLNWNDAFRNIYHALIMVKSDSTHPNMIYVDEGTYSPSLTGEFFSLGGKDHISLIGGGEEHTILDAEQTCQLICLHDIHHFSMEGFTLQNGYGVQQGGLGVDCCSYINFKNMKVTNIIYQITYL